MSVPGASRKMIEAGYLGRKSGQGFYDYTADKIKGRRPVNAGLERLLASERAAGAREPSREEIVARCMAAFVNEAAHCLSDGVLSEPMQGDIGTVFGLGFPPFTGGPFRYIDTVGVNDFVVRLERLVSRHGARFAPAPILTTMAADGTRFYSRAGDVP